jgi:hypothetical protein
MKNIKIIFQTFLLFLFFNSILTAQFKIDKYIFSSGGGSTTAGSYRVMVTAGQVLSGKSESPQNIMNSGFWYSYSALTDVKDTDMLPDVYMLFQNYPNPFNPVTKIRYQLPEESNVSLKIYNIIGEELAVLVNSMQAAGYYEVSWNGSGLASGFYICRIEAGTYISVKKLVLLK